MKINNQETNSVEIRPQVTVLSVLRHLNYKPWFAIAEFIDNSLQSGIANIETFKRIYGDDFKINVDIKLDASSRGRIVITDNAAGISSEDFQRAFKTAEVPADRSGLSEFGMGMKSAACWFAERWKVRTKSLGENVERTIKFDIDKIVKQNINSLEVETKKSANHLHYTTITLSGLHHVPQGRTIKKIKDHLSSIYRVFLNAGDVKITFNNESLHYESPNVLVSPKYRYPGVFDENYKEKQYEWKKNVEFSLGDGVKVNGFAALRETGSTSLAGFSLFRRGRLIVGSYDDPYRPESIFKRSNSYQSQRIFGELHLEGFEVSHTKDGFRWEHYEDSFLRELKKIIATEPLDLISQAENYRALPPKQSIIKLAEAAAKSVVNHIKNKIEPVLVNAKENKIPPPNLQEEIISSPFQISEHSVVVNDGEYEWNIVIRTSTDPSCEDWIIMSLVDEECDDVSIRKLIIDLSLAHPFSTQFIGSNNENIELFLRIASANCISLILTEEMTGVSPNIFLSHFNSLLRNEVTHTLMK